MGDKSKIEWTEATWNFLIGCLKKSAGCMNCYAIRAAWRLMHNPNPRVAKRYEGVVALDSTGQPNWTGRINFDDELLALPLKWTRPRRIFVNSLSDFFHPNVKPEWIAAAFGVMMATPHHTYQILTKHPDRAARILRDLDGVATQQRLTVREFVEEAALEYVDACHLQADMSQTWPLPNVQILTSIENQETADERLPWLVRIPAVVRGISAEPLLGPISLRGYYKEEGQGTYSTWLDYLDWVICGGESGPDSRPMHPDWAQITCAISAYGSWRAVFL
jgi:protein gp37